MYYVIFDLEWNNAYNSKTHKGMNEIIEIGAIKLDEKLNIVDSYNQLIIPRVSKKLTGRFKELTHITQEEIKNNGVDFDDAICDFAHWSESDNSIFMSWSDSDLYVLVDNFKKFRGTIQVDFIRRYADVQKYCMSYLPKTERVNQISLSNCAQRFEITANTENLHRALEDCFLTASCFVKVFDTKRFKNYVADCSTDYFERLVYKPYYLSIDHSEEFELGREQFECPICGGIVNITKPFDYANNTFRNFGVCPACSKKYWIYLRAKRTYDGVSVSKRVVPMNKKREKKIDR